MRPSLAARADQVRAPRPPEGGASA